MTARDKRPRIERGEVDVAAELESGRHWPQREAWIFDRLYRMAIDEGMWGLLDKEFRAEMKRRKVTA